jgi:two-component system, cell cycle sensor histidine kinase and response regulator CckA
MRFMFDFFGKLFDDSGYAARLSGGGWDAELVCLHGLADTLIWLAYIAIPVVLIYFVRRRRDVPFHWIFWMFGVFLFSCGFTHLCDVLMSIWPMYRFLALAKIVTALASWAAVFGLIPITQRALAMRSPEELQREIARRQRVEEALTQSHAQLERRVQERTAELAAANRALQAEIEERGRFEQELREQREWLRVTLTSIGDAVIATDTQTRVTFINPSAATLIGLPQEAAIGLPLEKVFQLVHEEERTTLASPVVEALREGRVVGPASRVVLRARGGVERPIDDSAAPIRDGAGNIAGAVLVFRDVTEKRRLEAQIQQARKMAAVGQLAGGVAHNFNNLLTIVLSYADLLRRGLAPESPYSDFAAKIVQSGERAAALTRQLLAFSRKQMTKPLVLDLNEAVAHLEKMFANLLGERIRLDTQLDPRLAPIRVDPAQLEQVLLNLALNARDAMPCGGVLTIRTANVVVTAADLHQQPETSPGPYVLIEVRDTGAGMDEETLSHLFEPFFTTKEVGQGTGLGLATVYGIVKMSGGFIEVHSEPAQGATFSLYLPAAGMGPLPPSEAIAPPLPIPHGQETVLLVEDEESVRHLAREVLQRSGYVVLEACNGVEALQVSRSFVGPIHLLLTDVMMPEMSGLELVEVVAAERLETRALFMSGYFESSPAHQEVLRHRFLEKPFSPGKLTHMIRSVLDT